ncbi:uncharacterized protein LOC120210590 [Hibiscus syriacus]|uniref:uncharacterized protein LOC120210590 n=1 Tax=Hibiscus syriacus TaxID=106335 RepID=UPI0019212FCC|nr:uncharacterized protein LOC120210590 [Hibiscus syriacus]
MKRLYIENHRNPSYGDVHFNSPTPNNPTPPLYITLRKLSPLCTPPPPSSSNCNYNMSSISSSPWNHNPSKPVIARVATLSINSDNMHGFGNEDDKSCSCSNGSVLQGSALVPTRHCSDGNDKDSGRERLKRHREEVAGRVSIPDKWGKEELLRDWMDCSSFDSLLAPTGLASARKALMTEGRRSSSQRLMRMGSIKHPT